MLETGSTVPAIALEDTAGRAVRLGDFRSTDNVLLYFMRSTSCPVCNGHVKDLSGRAAELVAANVRVLVAVPEGRAEAAAWQAKRELPFQVVTGKRGTPHEAVGLMRKVFGAMQPRPCGDHAHQQLRHGKASPRPSTTCRPRSDRR
jgi:peroxiredoxin